MPESDAPKTVRLAVAWPHHSFDPNKRGYPVITAAGVEVDANQADKIIESGAEHGVPIRKV